MAKHSGKFIFAMFFARQVAKYLNASYDDLSSIDGPYLLLSNHTTDFDPIFISCAMNQPIRFVASEHSMRKSFAGKLLRWIADPIIHQKGKVGIATTKDILKATREGSNVGLFPEGGRSFNGETQEILSSTAKLAKSTKVKLVTVKIIGGYEVQPRWCVKRNKGHIEVKLSRVYEPEELRAMDEAELFESICEDLYVRASVPADLTGIESTLFMAGPDEINPNMDIVELDRKQKEYVFAGKGDFCDELDLYEIDENHKSRLVSRGVLRADKDGFSFNGRSMDISGLAIVSRNTLIIHENQKHYELKGGILFSALKYMYQYEYLSQVQKG